LLLSTEDKIGNLIYLVGLLLWLTRLMQWFNQGDSLN